MSSGVSLKDILTVWGVFDWHIFAFLGLRPEKLTLTCWFKRRLLSLSSGVRSSYASQHSQLGHESRSALSPDRHIAPIYEDRTFQGPMYRHGHQGNLYRSTSGGCCPQPGLLVLPCCVKMSLNAEQINLRMIDRVVRKSTFGGFLHFLSSFYATSLVESPRSPLAFSPLPFLIIPI